MKSRRANAPDNRGESSPESRAERARPRTSRNTPRTPQSFACCSVSSSSSYGRCEETRCSVEV